MSCSPQYELALGMEASCVAGLAVCAVTISTNDGMASRQHTAGDWDCSFCGPYLRPVIDADRMGSWEG
jgi:hypothetical protein